MPTNGPRDQRRDAWLAEMWQPVREYHRDRDTTAEQADARARRTGLATFFGDERKAG